MFHTFFQIETNKNVFFHATFNLKCWKQLRSQCLLLVLITNQVSFFALFSHPSILQLNIFPSCCTESLLKDFEFSAPIEKQFWCLAIFLKLRSSQRDVLFEFSVRNQVYESAKIPRREINYIGDQKSAKSVTFVIPAISNLIHHSLKVEDSRKRNPNVQKNEGNP